MGKPLAKWISLCFIVLLGIAFGGCGDNSTLTDAPQVISITPKDGDVNVPVNINIVANFDQAMDTTTIEGTTNINLKKRDDTALIETTVTYNQSTFTAILDPTSDLEQETSYKVSLTKGIKSVDGIPIIQEYTWIFVTGQSTDLTPPTFNGAKDVAQSDISSTSLTLRWDGASDNNTSPENITYLVYMASISGAQNYQIPYRTWPGVDSYLVTNLTPETNYYFVVLAVDESGNVSTTKTEVVATTLPAEDTTPPVVVITRPTEGAVNVIVNTNISTTFNEDMDETTINPNTVKLSSSESTPIVGTINYNASTRTVTFFPSAYLDTDRTYFFTLTTDIKDESGNPLEREYSFSFITGASLPADYIPPTFAGAKEATATEGSSDSITLTWDLATDNMTPEENIVYLLYRTTMRGAETYTTPTYTTAPGVKFYIATGLDSATIYYFVVLARDQSGNVSQTIKEVYATTNP